MVFKGNRYKVYEGGRVWSYVSGKFLKPFTNERGLPIYGFGWHGVQISMSRLLLTTFVRPPKQGEKALHWDDDPSNNALDNLRWGTDKDNKDDSKRNGTRAFGERMGTAKLTEKQVLEIINSPKYYGYARDLAKRFGVKKGTVVDIKRGLWWAHLRGHHANGTGQRIRKDQKASSPRER